jgi:hypothetical protein
MSLKAPSESAPLDWQPTVRKRQHRLKAGTAMLFPAALSGAEAKNAEAEWKLMDPEGKGSVTFKEALRNKPAIEEFKADFRKLDKRGKGYITLKDLPAVKQ